MEIHRIRSVMAIAGGLALASVGAAAQDSATKPHVPLEKTIGQVKATGPVPSLAVINSASAKLEGGKLILTGVAKNSIVFADGPVRAAGHVTTEQFIMQCDEGMDNFAIDPPNATVSVLGGVGSDVADAVVTLKAPKLEGTTLTFDVAILEGNLDGAAGPAALFIDHFAGGFGGGVGFGGGFGGGGFHGGYAHVGNATFAHVGGYHGGAYWHAPVYHGAWYGGAGVAAGVVAGAAIVAAAAAPYPSYCGYYPYPPCY